MRVPVQEFLFADGFKQLRPPSNLWALASVLGLPEAWIIQPSEDEFRGMLSYRDLEVDLICEHGNVRIENARLILWDGDDNGLVPKKNLRVGSVLELVFDCFEPWSRIKAVQKDLEQCGVSSERTMVRDVRDASEVCRELHCLDYGLVFLFFSTADGERLAEINFVTSK